MKHSTIQIGTDTWIIMREYREIPKAIVHRLTATNGESKYMLMTWEPIAADRRLVGMHASLDDADKAVPWPNPADANMPPIPNHSPEATAEHQRRQARTEAQAARRMGKRVPVDNVPPQEAWR